MRHDVTSCLSIHSLLFLQAIYAERRRSKAGELRRQMAEGQASRPWLELADPTEIEGPQQYEGMK
jgi:hypothetical protein